jgi:hypothetical protein
MMDTNTVPGIEANALTRPSVYVSATTAPTIEPFIRVPHHGFGGLLIMTATLSFMSNPSVESDLVAFTELRARSPQVTESRILADGEGPEAQQVRRAALYRLRAMQFPQEEREQRIAKALAALHAPNPLSGVDRATWKWAAEDVDLEDI